jgi:hypothetical protein
VCEEVQHTRAVKSTSEQPTETAVTLDWTKDKWRHLAISGCFSSHKSPPAPYSTCYVTPSKSTRSLSRHGGIFLHTCAHSKPCAGFFWSHSPPSYFYPVIFVTTYLLFVATYLLQGCFIRPFGTFIMVEYALNTQHAYNTIVFLSEYDSPQNGHDSPQNHP